MYGKWIIIIIKHECLLLKWKMRRENRKKEAHKNVYGCYGWFFLLKNNIYVYKFLAIKITYNGSHKISNVNVNTCLITNNKNCTLDECYTRKQIF